MHFSISTIALIACVRLVAGHGAITKATGDLGGEGSAIGIDPTTPRTGTDDVPFQQDTTVFDGDAESACGETDQTSEADAVNDIEAGVTKVMSESKAKQLPQVSQGGEVRMTLHQVNSDGAGPYVCMIDATGTGTNWVAMKVTTQVAGDDGNNDDGEVTDHPLVAAVAQDQTCTGKVGGQERVCMVRCQNPQGPFGGCVPVQMSANATKVTAPKMSQTGGTAEDDVDAIVDAAEEAEDAQDDDDGLDLFDRARYSRRKAKRAFRSVLRRTAKKSQKANKRAAKYAVLEG